MKILTLNLSVLCFALFPMSSFAIFNADEGYFNAEVAREQARFDHASYLAGKLAEIYSGEFAGKQLKVEFDWTAGNINAYATYDDDDNPIIKITGGMAAHPLLTGDGLALVVCHELGHFLAGEPKKLRGRSTKKSWASAEGQADYFSTAKCMKRLLLKGAVKREQALEISADVLEEARAMCRSSLCEKLVLASYSVASVYAEVKFYYRRLLLSGGDEYSVRETILGHPDPQCRLDTMIAGALCADSMKVNFKSAGDGDILCPDREYMRPGCWYAGAK